MTDFRVAATLFRQDEIPLDSWQKEREWLSFLGNTKGYSICSTDCANKSLSVSNAEATDGIDHAMDCDTVRARKVTRMRRLRGK